MAKLIAVQMIQAAVKEQIYHTNKQIKKIPVAYTKMQLRQPLHKTKLDIPIFFRDSKESYKITTTHSFLKDCSIDSRADSNILKLAILNKIQKLTQICYFNVQ